MGSLVVYLIMTSLIFLYTYLLGGQASLMLLYMLILSPAVSLTLTFLVRKKIQCSVRIPKSEVEKNGIVIVEVQLQNKSLLPIPLLDIVFAKAENFKLSEAQIFRTSLGGHRSVTYCMEYTAERRGICDVGLENLILRDYLGFIKLSLTKLCNQSTVKSITVLPEITNLRANSRILISSSQSDIQTEEDECSVTLNNSTGEPGYEFREYNPGDPLHKIHWKLSAKRDKFMVRKDQGAGIQRKLLILDPCIKPVIIEDNQRNGFIQKVFNRQVYGKSNEETMLVEERVLEALLSICNSIIKIGIEVDVLVFDNNRWRSILLKDLKGLSDLQHSFAGYKFYNSSNLSDENRFPFTELSEQKGRSLSHRESNVIIFSGAPDKQLFQAAEACRKNSFQVDTVLINNYLSKDLTDYLVQDNLWLIEAHRDFNEVFS